MQDPAIEIFFSSLKEAWLKKNIKSSMGDNEVEVLQQTCERMFTLNEWLPNAAKKAGQMSLATHPCTFSHPSARKNKNGYVSSIVVNIASTTDGFLKSGNVAVETDALGNAAVLPVYKFLTLIMQDNKNLLAHIQQDTVLAKELLTIEAESYQSLKDGFLAIMEEPTEIITSSKIKQVYFPVQNDYHLLSILTNSGMVYQLRARIDSIRFSDEVKALREKKKKNECSEQGYSEIYGLTTIGYGGTKPQNISVLNNKNGGKSHLLSSLPPNIEKRNVYFPKSDFFVESLTKSDAVYIFKALHKILQVEHNNINIRDRRDNLIQALLDTIIDKMWEVRAVSQAQYHEKSSQLHDYQLVWLHTDFAKKREESEQWLDTLFAAISRWVIRGYEKALGKQAIKFGEEERLYIYTIINKNKEAFL